MQASLSHLQQFTGDWQAYQELLSYLSDMLIATEGSD